MIVFTRVRCRGYPQSLKKGPSFGLFSLGADVTLSAHFQSSIEVPWFLKAAWHEPGAPQWPL
jgi:hypothetical protein